VRAGAADFRGLVGAFHGRSSEAERESVRPRRAGWCEGAQSPTRQPASGNPLLQQKCPSRSTTCPCVCPRRLCQPCLPDLWITTGASRPEG
jgi:hypothetical protein